MFPLQQMRDAAARSAPYVRRTPLIETDSGALLKLENMQSTASFKVRGFFAAALVLPKEQISRGLITVSAGNAAQACAYVAYRLGVPCRTFMFDTAPRPKLDGVKRWGATPVLRAREDLLAWMADRGWEREPETFIHPFADEELMAGYGGLGLEIVEEAPDVERIVVPVGGGGLITGIAAGAKAVKPDVEIVGVQSSGYPLWPRVMASGEPIQLTPHTIADGTTGPFTTDMYERMKANVDRWIEVSEEDLRGAVGRLARECKVVAEGAGALPYAALDLLPPDRRTVAVISGGNVDPALLANLLIE